MVSEGAYVTVTEVSPEFPEVSVAFAVIVLDPSVSAIEDTVHEVVPVTGSHWPGPTFTSTLLSATLSDAVPLTVMEEVVNSCPSIGDMIDMEGFVVSCGVYLTLTEFSPEFPEVSVAFAVIVFEPSVSCIEDTVHEVEPVTGSHWPDPTFTSTLLSAALSDAVPLTVMEEVAKI